MSDEAGFLRAIAANLHDDLPRLAYADWLDDRSDPRGEYLRLQVELARTWTYLDQKPHLYARLAELTPALDPGWLAAVRRCTTPAPPVDVAKLFPELAPLAKTAVRLHPRPGEAPVDASKLGGPILWPQREPWPDCPEHGTPLVPVVQLRKDDVPELGFPPGTDLFQLLWCLEWHERGNRIRIRALWRDSTAVEDPGPGMSDAVPTEWRVPAPCVLHPERVVEYPITLEEYPHPADDVEERVGRSVELQTLVSGLPDLGNANGPLPERAGFFYRQLLGCAHGIKAVGHPRWLRLPLCRCGNRTEPFFSIMTWEYGDEPWARWRPIEDRHGPTGEELNHALGMEFGDDWECPFVVCRHCPGHPVILQTKWM